MATKAELEKLAKRVQGMKPGEEKAEEILDSANDDGEGWTGYWPVTKNGVFTGGICEVNRDDPQIGRASCRERVCLYV